MGHHQNPGVIAKIPMFRQQAGFSFTSHLLFIRNTIVYFRKGRDDDSSESDDDDDDDKDVKRRRRGKSSSR